MMTSTEVKYKNTVIGKIPVEWEIKRLGDLGKILNGLTYSPQDINDDGILVLRSSNIKDDQIVFTDNVYIKKKSLKYNPVEENDILICVRNGSKSLIGKNAIITKNQEGMAFGAFMSVYRSNSNHYLYHCFKSSIYTNYIKQNLGATINSINGNDLKGFKFPIPPLPEQQKIAEILSTWDKAIQETNNIIKALEKRNKMLANRLLNNERWEKKKLGELFVRIVDKNIEKNQTVTTISARRGFIKQEDFFNKTVASKDLSGYYLINKGDFCYNKSYSKEYDWGVVKRLNDFEKAVVTTLYICFRLNQKDQNIDFWELYFANNILDKGLSKIAHEGGRAHGLLNVTASDFFSLKIGVPPLEEQNKIAEILHIVNKELKQYKQKLENLKQQKKGLMQQLLTGRIRVITKN